jgi:hypothetical protein
MKLTNSKHDIIISMIRHFVDSFDLSLSGLIEIANDDEMERLLSAFPEKFAHYDMLATADKVKQPEFV